jgi:hypothetical protein
MQYMRYGNTILHAGLSAIGYRLSAIFVLFVLFASPTAAAAQNRSPDADPVILHTVAADENGQTRLKVFFTLRDRNGQPLDKNSLRLASEGSITLGDETVTATIGEPTDPIKIALLIDGSGSMNLQDSQGVPLIEQVRAAAQRMIDIAPSNAEFVVLRFAETVERQHEGFLRKRDQAQLIKDAIGGFKVNESGTGDTCLYDAANQAIDALIAANPAPTERLSVVLFTDGKNRQAGGALCSNLAAPEVIRKALGAEARPIPIYTIGVCANADGTSGEADCGNINAEELTALAKETQAFPVIGPREDLDGLFARLMEGLSSQWVAEATLCPAAGRNVALLEMQLDETLLSTDVPFEAAQACLQPTTFAVSSQVYAPETDAYTVTLDIGSPERVKRLTVAVYDYAEGGSQIGTPLSFENLPPQLIFALPGSGMATGSEYFLRVMALGQDDKPLLNEKGNPILAMNPFKHSPTLSFSILGVEPDWDAEQLVVELKVSGAGGRTLSFGGELRDPETGQSEALPVAVPQGNTLRLAMPRMLREAEETRGYNLTLALEHGGVPLRQSYARRIEPQLRAAQPLLPPAVWLGLLVGLASVLVGGSVLIWRRRRPMSVPKPYSDATQIRPSTPRQSAASSIEKKLASGTSTSSGLSAQVPVPSVGHAAAASGTALASQASDGTQLHLADATHIARRLRLRVLQTPSPGRELEQTVSSFPFLIGRTQGEIKFPHDPKVSSQHLEISESAEGFVLRDLESRNGTWLGERRLARGESVVFCERVVLRLGPDTTIEVGMEEG